MTRFKAGSPGRTILEKEPTVEASFVTREDANPDSRQKGLRRLKLVYKKRLIFSMWRLCVRLFVDRYWNCGPFWKKLCLISKIPKPKCVLEHSAHCWFYAPLTTSLQIRSDRAFSTTHPHQQYNVFIGVFALTETDKNGFNSNMQKCSHCSDADIGTNSNGLQGHLSNGSQTHFIVRFDHQ